MKAAALSRETERAVLERLATGASVAGAAQATGLSFHTAERLAVVHGYPDRDAVRAALAAMKAEDDRPEVQGSTTAQRVDGARELVTLPVSSLHPDPDNPRDDLGDVTELAESIRATGLLQPIVARRRAGRYIVVAGHRRLAALQLLARTETDVLVVPDMRPDEVLAAMIIENGQRRDLDPIEEARAFQRLKKARGVSSAELGQQLGRSQALIDGRLRLLELPPEDQDRVRAGEMGVGHAIAKARELSGNVRASSKDARIPYLAVEHALSAAARARCKRVHNLKKVLVGQTACGQCWESVIRANERKHLVDAAAEPGATCATCGHTDTTAEADPS